MFSHRPILYYQTQQRTNVAPPYFIKLPKFLILRPLYKFYSKNLFFPISLCNIYPKFRFFAPPLWAAHGGGRPSLPPRYATGYTTCIIDLGVWTPLH